MPSEGNASAPVNPRPVNGPAGSAPPSSEPRRDAQKPVTGTFSELTRRHADLSDRLTGARQQHVKALANVDRIAANVADMEKELGEVATAIRSAQ